MGNSEYIIPANSKNSMLIVGLFNTTDLTILITGTVITLILLFVVKTSSLLGIIFILLPILTCAFLVVPLPNQHNVRTFIKNVYSFLVGQREYRWKGWCVRSGDTK